MEKILSIIVVLCLCGFVAAQDAEKVPPSSDKPGDNYSGMYSFLRDGEFVQLTVEDAGHVTGFVSRFGDLESDKGVFLDHFFKEGSLQGNKLHFTTETVHGVWIDFAGTIDRGEGKRLGDEAYYVLNGTLIEHVTDADKKVSSKSRQVALKSFPQDLGPSPGKRD